MPIPATYYVCEKLGTTRNTGRGHQQLGFPSSAISLLISVNARVQLYIILHYVHNYKRSDYAISHCSRQTIFLRGVTDRVHHLKGWVNLCNQSGIDHAQQRQAVQSRLAIRMAWRAKSFSIKIICAPAHLCLRILNMLYRLCLHRVCHNYSCPNNSHLRCRVSLRRLFLPHI